MTTESSASGRPWGQHDELRRAGDGPDRRREALEAPAPAQPQVAGEAAAAASRPAAMNEAPTGPPGAPSTPA